jgi:hypothetical protein
MHLVAIAELAGSIGAAIGPLATDIGTTPYELRLVLNAGLPAVVLATVDEALARGVVEAVARHGHTPLSCDRREVAPSARMTALRDFQLTEDAVLARAGSSDSVRYDDIAVLLRAMHRATSETVQQVKEHKLRPVMAIATGGLVTSKTTTREVVTRTEQREQVLYVFRRSGAPPWILRERSANYGGLGADLRPTSLESFAATIERLRGVAPQAAYDERLLSYRPVRGVAQGIEATDILAHLLARHLSPVGGGRR